MSTAECIIEDGGATWTFLVPYRRNPDATFEVVGKVKLETVKLTFAGPAGLESIEWLEYCQYGDWPGDMAERQVTGLLRCRLDDVLKACSDDWEERRTADLKRRFGVREAFEMVRRAADNLVRARLQE